MDDQSSYCPVYEAINVLQEKWTLHIIRELLNGPSGFNELGRAVGGVNSNTLAHRLEHLETLGILSKTIVSTMPPKTRYALSPAGVELSDVINAITKWGVQHLSKPVS